MATLINRPARYLSFTSYTVCFYKSPSQHFDRGVPCFMLSLSNMKLSNSPKTDGKQVRLFYMELLYRFTVDLIGVMVFEVLMR